jgi:hypothetical protein
VRIGPARYLAQPVEMGGISGQPIGQATLLRNLDQELEPELSRYRRGSVAVLSSVGAMMAIGYAIWRARRRRLVR